MKPSGALRLAQLALHDPRVALVPIEHLSARGMSPECARVLALEGGFEPAQIDLFDQGFALYWTRSSDLARRTRTWLAPRRRHVAIAREPLSVLPYASLMNTSAWLIYASDLDPERSDPELVAYLLAHGDRIAHSREVSTAAVETALWWLERTDAECDAFVRAASSSARPDAGAFQELGRAIPWLRQLEHERLKPPASRDAGRRIPGTGLVVPSLLEERPPDLVARWTGIARAAVAEYRAAWCHSDPRAVARLCTWLAESAPPLLVTSGQGRIVWDPERPDRADALAVELDGADAVAVESLREDLVTIERHTRAFFAAAVDLDELPRDEADDSATGYTTLRADRRLIAYDLREPGIDRLHGPPLPYARAMLGARTAHEWGHLGDRAGWVVRTISSEEHAKRCAALAAGLDAVIEAAPPPIRERTARDLAELTGATSPGAASPEAASPRATSPGAALARIALARLPDYRANVIARELMTPIESETYVRHNIRTLRPEYAPWQLWRMLIRYLYEFQYLGSHLAMSSVPDPRDFFLASTWFEQDFIESRVLDTARFDALAEAVAALCVCHAVDAKRVRLAGSGRELTS